MKWIKLLRIDDCALLQSETDTQYVVVNGYDPTQPEDQQWASGTYFEYWNDAKRKVDCLQSALNYLRSMTEEKVYGEKGLLIKEWTAAETGADLKRCGLAGSPTKVKQIMSVVLTASDFKKIEPTEAGISNFIHELIEDHTLG